MTDVGCGNDDVMVLIDERTRLRGKDHVTVETVRIRRRLTSMPGRCPELGSASHVGGRQWQIGDSP